MDIATWTPEQWHIALIIGQYALWPLTVWIVFKAKESLRELIADSVKKELNGFKEYINKRLNDHEGRLRDGDEKFERLERSIETMGHKLDVLSKAIDEQKRWPKQPR